MSGGEAIGRVREVGPEPVGREYAIPLHKDDGAVMVHLVSGGGLLPFGNAKGSGTLASGLAGAASFGYAADEPAAIATTPINYVRNVSTANIKVGLFVDPVGGNTFAATAITFTAYKNGVATLFTIVVPAGGSGLFQGSGAFPYLDGDTWDLRADNPGGEAAKAISFGFGIDFF